MFGRRSFILVLALSGCNGAIGGSGPEAENGDAGSPPPGLIDGGGDADASTGIPCDEECEDGLVCAGGLCVISEGLCEDDGDCAGDTYCCVDSCLSPSETDGACVRYGTGDRDSANQECRGVIPIGVFSADVQCEWSGPPDGDPFPDHVQVLTTPLVADLPHDSGAAAEIIIVSYNCRDGSSPSSQGSSSSCYGVIRVLNGQDCTQLESIDDPDNRIIAASTPAIADLDNDGTAEIVSHRAVTGAVAFRWNDGSLNYERFWAQNDSLVSDDWRWDGPSIHDLDGDGLPEVISGSEVRNGQTGALLTSALADGDMPRFGRIPVLGDVDNDGDVELIAESVYRWDSATTEWVVEYADVTDGLHFAFADFGTPGATADDFNIHSKDGIAEVVSTGAGVTISTLSGQVLLSAGGGGGPPTIGDFDNDGHPEVASAGGRYYRVFDMDCLDSGNTECEGDGIRWSQPSQDLSSGQTGSSLFDFEGDGRDEAVYADECFTRIYDGATGTVLYSAFRTSATWFENVVVADLDRDQHTELIVGSNSNQNIACPEIDPIHLGTSCSDNTDCASGTCDAGLCRCAADDQCSQDYRCTAPPAGTAGSGNTCRAYHPADVGMTGVRVLRDRLDRWAPSRSLWNQHAYSVTNVNDDLSVPRTSAWLQNFLEPALNNYRRQTQGEGQAEDFADLTGRFQEVDQCTTGDTTLTLVADVCNRGTRTVGASLPVTFYRDSPDPGNALCIAHTDQPMPAGGCLEVSCEVVASGPIDIALVVNDDGESQPTTIECELENNGHTAHIPACQVVD
jgi:hypothetical protein